MVESNTLVNALDELLSPEQGAVDDVSNNGLQVEGTAEVQRVMFGVDACQDLFERAIDMSADLLFVHHGLSWGGGIKHFTGMSGNRLRLLFKNSINLYASHLPLDMHPELGHNAIIAEKLGVETPEPFFEYQGVPIGYGGTLSKPLPLTELAGDVDDWLGASSHLINETAGPVESVGIVSGGGADAVQTCAEEGYDCLITGEMEHSQYHPAIELGISVIAAGHYRTETPGVIAVMEWVRDRYDVECSFIDLPTGL